MHINVSITTTTTTTAAATTTTTTTITNNDIHNNKYYYYTLGRDGASRRGRPKGCARESGRRARAPPERRRRRDVCVYIYRALTMIVFTMIVPAITHDDSATSPHIHTAHT